MLGEPVRTQVMLAAIGRSAQSGSPAGVDERATAHLLKWLIGRRRLGWGVGHRGPTCAPTMKLSLRASLSA